ncbi:MAG: cation:proton antiporter [Eubacteriales bacterium]
MLVSLAFIFVVGMILGKVLQLGKLPSLLGMLITGIVLGPYVLNVLDASVLGISAELRKIALIIILTRAGLNLNIYDLKKVGRPAVLMCFLPACLEILGMVLLAPMFLGITILEAAIMGTVVAAVSPAVIVPRMLTLMETGYGTKQSIPQMIMAGASVDDVFVIVLFAAFTGLAQGGEITPASFVVIPTSIILGLVGGVIVGVVLTLLFTKIHMRDSEKVLLILATSFFLVTIEDSMSGMIGFSGLLAVMALGATLQQRKNEVAKRLSEKFSRLWVGAEILLFVLVGATVDIQYALKAGVMAVVLIVCVLGFRMVGVFVCLIKTDLNKKERLFTAFAYMPKATVQAAIGGLPLSMGLACGDIVLTVAVVAILITAPVGAKMIDMTYKKFLQPS